MSDFRVMSFNLRGASWSDGVNAWPHRAALNVETVLRYSPDVIGFQEFMDGNRETYQTALSGYEHQLGPPYSRMVNSEFNACYWKCSRLRRIGGGGFWLSSTPDRFSGDWGTACVRSAAWSRLELPNSRVQFVHLNTHLDHVSAMAQTEGAKVIVRELARIAGDSTPVVLTGDFNCTPGSDTYRIFLAAGFADSFLNAGNKDGDEAITFHAFSGRSTGHGRIDWILTRNGAPGSREHGGNAAHKFTVKAHAIIRDAHPPLYPSDHFPVIADLHLA